MDNEWRTISEFLHFLADEIGEKYTEDEQIKFVKELDVYLKNLADELYIEIDNISDNSH